MAAQFLRSSDTCQLHQSRPLDAVLYSCAAFAHMLCILLDTHDSHHSVFSLSSDDGLCASISGELLGSTNGCSSIESLPSNNSDGHKELVQVQALISPSSAEDADLSLPDTAVTSLDCDPVPLQCSPAQAQSECPDSSTSMQEQVGISEEKQSLLEGDLQSGLQSQAPHSSTESSEPLSP